VDFKGKTTQTFSWCTSIKHVIFASVPTILSMIFFMFVAITNIYFMGHLDDPDLLAGVGLGAMLLNVFCFAVS
jgi:Na+-driven multidrug efflux pump